MTKENDIYQLFYRRFPDLRWRQHSNIASDVSEIEAGSFGFEAFIDGLSDNASDLPALKLPDGRTLVIDDPYDDRNEMKGEVTRHIAEYLRAADAYERELRGSTREAVKQALVEATTKDTERKSRVRQKREGNLPFSSPSARADVARWAQLAPWTPEQAVALSLDKNPDAVDSQKLLLAPASSPFRVEYQERLEQMHRAIAAGTVKSPLTLADFYIWARNAGITLPDELKKISTYAEIFPDKSSRKSASQAKRDNSVLRVLAALVCNYLDIDIYALETPHISDKQAARITDLLSIIHVKTPGIPTIKKQANSAIKLVREENVLHVKTIINDGKR